MNFYYNKSTDLLPNVEPQNGLQKFVQFPLIRLVIVLIFLAPAPVIVAIVRRLLIEYTSQSTAIYAGYFVDVLLMILLLMLYNLYTCTIENRKAHELSANKMGFELGVGVFVAFAVLALYIISLFVLGYYRIEEINSFDNVLFMFFTQMKVGLTEELLFRVIIFKLSEELVGSWYAIALQGILFGFAHFNNPNATIFTTITLIVAFSIFFGGGYIITRRIWFVFGFHWSWNFFQSGIWGLNNSGNIQPSLITPIVEGPIWITGGNWGPELSIITVLILFILSLYFIKIAVKNNQLVKPVWRRERIDQF